MTFSSPRRGPLDPADYPMQPWSGHYPGPPQVPQGYPQSPSYPTPNSQSGPPYSGYPPGQPYARSGDPRGVDPGYYPHPRWLKAPLYSMIHNAVHRDYTNMSQSVMSQFLITTPLILVSIMDKFSFYITCPHLLFIILWYSSTFLLLAPSREAPCGRMCPHLLPLHFVDYGTTLWRAELGVERTGRGDLWRKMIPKFEVIVSIGLKHFVL